MSTAELCRLLVECRSTSPAELLLYESTELFVSIHNAALLESIIEPGVVIQIDRNHLEVQLMLVRKEPFGPCNCVPGRRRMCPPVFITVWFFCFELSICSSCSCGFPDRFMTKTFNLNCEVYSFLRLQMKHKSCFCWIFFWWVEFLHSFFIYNSYSE